MLKLAAVGLIMILFLDMPLGAITNNFYSNTELSLHQILDQPYTQCSQESPGGVLLFPSGAMPLQPPSQPSVE